MNLTPTLETVYTSDRLSAREAQAKAQFIAFGPIVFQISRMMIKFGIFEMLQNHSEGLALDELVKQTGLSVYAIKILTDSSLTIGTIKYNKQTDRFLLTNTGWFLLTNNSVKVNIDFNHDVNYAGMFNLEEALINGNPAGLKHFGTWPTVYEGLSQLPERVQKSWFAFDHFYSDCSFEAALQIVFSKPVHTLYDVGGNTGRWAMQCVSYDANVKVTILDLPQQLELMKQAISGQQHAERVDGYAINFLDKTTSFPSDKKVDAIWMSQFLDCFGEEEIVSILERARKSMSHETTLYIMETLWDRQEYETAAFCLTQISVYFTAIANGNSKMYHSDDLFRLIDMAGLKVNHIHDNLGWGHSIIECKIK